MIKLSFSVGKETLNPVDVGSFTNIFLFSINDSMVFPLNGESPLSFVLIVIVDAIPSQVLKDEKKRSGSFSVGNRKGDNFPLSPLPLEDQFLSLSSKAFFALFSSAKEGFLKFKFSREEFPLWKKGIVDSLSNDPEDFLGGSKAIGKVEIASSSQKYPDRRDRREE